MTASAAREKGVIPEADEETLLAFSPSEMKLYRHAMDHKWTVDELVQTIQLIKSADFGCALSFTVGHDEQGRFASAYFGDVPLQWIYLSYTMYMFCIYYIYS